jgi:Mrp family chromosome partitioning ATPase/capsular polysaccharide biosynthesis protein
MQPDPDTLSLDQVLDILRRRAAVIALCVLVVGGMALVISKRETKKYTATAAIAFEDSALGQQIAGLSSSASSAGSLLTQRANDLEAVRLGDVAEKTANKLGNGLTAEKVSNSVSVGHQGESGVVSVSVTATSPALAAEIANTYAKVFVSERTSSNQAYLRSALAVVNKQLAALKPAQRIGQDGLQLQNRAQTLHLLSELGYGDVKVAQEAFVPASASSPKTSRNTVLGLVLGLLLGLGLAFLFEHFDRRIRRSQEFEAIYGQPLLGLVPHSRALARRRDDRVPLPPREAEAFRVISAQLRFLDVGRRVQTVLITSPDADDGKTTVALHLAEATARLGSRVLLVEGDLRDPTLAERLGLAGDYGLAETLRGANSLREATQSVELAGAYYQGAARTARSNSVDGNRANGSLTHAPNHQQFDVIVAGSSVTPDPAGLLETDTMSAVLELAKSKYDLVVIDTPLLTSVSDGFPLLGKVDGILVVGRMGHSRRDEAERLQQVLELSGAPLLGIVANGVKARSRAGNRHASPTRPSGPVPPVPRSPKPTPLQPAAKL